MYCVNVCVCVWERLCVYLLKVREFESERLLKGWGEKGKKFVNRIDLLLPSFHNYKSLPVFPTLSIVLIKIGESFRPFSHLGSFINDVTVLRGRSQRFCVNSTNPSVIKCVKMGRRGQQIFNIAWRHLWTTPFKKILLTCFKMGNKDCEIWKYVGKA